MLGEELNFRQKDKVTEKNNFDDDLDQGAKK